MPKVTIWIRVADEAKWEAIENKPEWLHEHLSYYDESIVNRQRRIHEELSSTTTKSTGMISEAFLPEEQALVMCEHCQPKGQCNVKNCKFGRGIK